MIFDVFIWAQLELQLGIICASLPALRVFFRRYLSATFSRATHSGFGVGHSHKGSVIDPVSIQVIEDHERHAQNDFDDKGHYPKQSVGETTVADMDLESWSPSITGHSEAGLVNGAHEYETYDMQVIDRSGDSIRSPSFKRTKSAGRGQNFSQPFSQTHTTFYESQ